ncbi:hypothetical protein ES703_51198 [subsurface metagenome]
MGIPPSVELNLGTILKSLMVILAKSELGSIAKLGFMDLAETPKLNALEPNELAKITSDSLFSPRDSFT